MIVGNHVIPESLNYSLCLKMPAPLANSLVGETTAQVIAENLKTPPTGMIYIGEDLFARLFQLGSIISSRKETPKSSHTLSCQQAICI